MKKILSSLIAAAALIGAPVANAQNYGGGYGQNGGQYYGAQQPGGQMPGRQMPGGQNNSLAGNWYCEMGFQNTARGVAPQAVGQQIQVRLEPNGQAYGQGVDMGSAGSFPFQFRGQWSVNGREFAIMGQSQGGVAGQAQFVFVSEVSGPNMMSRTHHYQNAKRQVMASMCQRTG